MRRESIAALCIAAGFLVSIHPATAQQRLTGLRSTVVGPVWEMWSFGDGLLQPLQSGSESVRIEKASQWTIPLAVVVPLGSRFSLDVSGAYASMNVELEEADPLLSTDSYSLSGLTDTKVRLTTKLAGDNVLFTLGFNAPTGKVELDDEELSALRVMAAPALAFTMPTLGTGTGGTAGVVLARQVANWAWAFGASYEMRGEYSPVAVAGGLSTVDFNPSDAIHVSLGSNGLIGQHEMTFGVSGDFFGDDELASGGGPPTEGTKLGPIYTLEWQLALATRRLREATIYLVDRYRTSYEQAGEKVDDSAGNYLDAGLRMIFPAGQRMGLTTALSLRHQTGLESDNTLATAAVASGALTVGLSREVGSGYMLQPFVRAQMGKIETADESSNATAFGAGITLSRRF